MPVSDDWPDDIAEPTEDPPARLRTSQGVPGPGFGWTCRCTLVRNRAGMEFMSFFFPECVCPCVKTSPVRSWRTHKEGGYVVDEGEVCGNCGNPTARGDPVPRGRRHAGTPADLQTESVTVSRAGSKA